MTTFGPNKAVSCLLFTAAFFTIENEKLFTIKIVHTCPLQSAKSLSVNVDVGFIDISIWSRTFRFIKDCKRDG